MILDIFLASLFFSTWAKKSVESKNNNNNNNNDARFSCPSPIFHWSVQSSSLLELRKAWKNKNNNNNNNDRFSYSSPMYPIFFSLLERKESRKE